MSRMHPIISITYLEPTIDQAEDPFGRVNRQMSKPPPAEYVDGNDEYEVERIVNKRVSLVKKRGSARKVRKVEYLIRWKGYGPEDDAWYDVIDLDHCLDLIKEYDSRTGV